MFAGKNISLKRENRLLAAPFSFCATSGIPIWIQGPNGSGKSSFLRLLAGLLSAPQGEFLWEGEPCDVLSATHRQQVAYLGHALGVWPERTVSQHFSDDQALEKWGLHLLSDVPVRFLSQGQRQRLALLRTFNAQRKLWLLDEPSQNLDAEGKSLLADVLKMHLSAGGLIFCVSHESPLNLAAHTLQFS